MVVNWFSLYLVGCHHMEWKLALRRKISKSLMLQSFHHKEKLHQNWHLMGGIVLRWSILLTGHFSSSLPLMFCLSKYYNTQVISCLLDLELRIVSSAIYFFLKICKSYLGIARFSSISSDWSGHKWNWRNPGQLWCTKIMLIFLTTARIEKMAQQHNFVSSALSLCGT